MLNTNNVKDVDPVFTKWYEGLNDYSNSHNEAIRYEKFSLLFPEKVHILLACFPKSGSSFLRELIKNLPNMTQVALVTGYDRREQELSTDELILHHSKNYVAQHHVRYSVITERLMKNFNLKPVVLVRNIFDVVESLHDHFYREGPVLPMGFLPNNWNDWNRDHLLNFICDMIMPWYFNFYFSWTLRDDKLLVSYEELVKNTHETISKITEYSNIKCNAIEIDNSIKMTTKQQNLRLNIGKTGRGDLLPQYIKDKIRDLSKYYGSENMSVIGL